jgi:hypothetical protein
VYYVVALLGFIIVVHAVLVRIEKRLVWPYGEPEVEPRQDDASGYGTRWVGDARDAGFLFLGWSADLKGTHYRIRYALMVPPERDCLVIVGVGRMFGISQRGTWIYSFLTDGRVFYSTDNQSCVEVDPLRQWRSHLVRANSFYRLLQRHREMIRDLALMPRALSPGRELDEFRIAREERFQSMSRQGWIAFCDATATRWHYTTWGALRLVILTHSIGLLRAITFGRIPRTA